MELTADKSSDSTWAERLALNLISYSVILIPIAIIVFITKWEFCPQKLRDNRLIRLFVFGFEESQSKSHNYDYLDGKQLLIDNSQDKEKPIAQKQTINYAILCCCFLGLQVSYLIWGILQEKIMTTEYESNQIRTNYNRSYIETQPSNSTNIKLIKFHDSQFLVFLNRITAFIVSILALVYTRTNYTRSRSDPNQPAKHSAPLYEFIYCSFSNIMSSWCQYEALKYVNFPTQVLSKSCKVIPVMLMSTFLMRKTYKRSEYLRASLLSIGMFIFLLNQSSHATIHNQSVDKTQPSSEVPHDHVLDDPSWTHRISRSSMASGIFILALYLMFDSFTSNWQSSLFSRYSVNEWQMMAATNFYSILLTLTSLYQLGHLGPAISLLARSKSLFIDCSLMSLSSSIGQLFVFFTIKRFGPVTFAIIMTLRQLFAFILSCRIFSHDLTVGALFGVVVIFSVIFWEISLKMKKNKS